MKTHKQLTDDYFNEAQKLLELASNSAIEHIKVLVIRILKKDKSLVEYMQCMGTACFFHKNDYSLGLYERESFKELNDFMEKYDHDLNLTGYPMIIYPDGSIKYDW